MRNHITSDHAAWTNSAHQPKLTMGTTNSSQTFESLKSDQVAESYTAASEVGTVFVAPASDFEGFGSFA